MESLLSEKWELQPKHSSTEVLQAWRDLCGVVKNPKRRFRFTTNLSKRREAAEMREANQVPPPLFVYEKLRIAVLVSKAAFEYIKDAKLSSKAVVEYIKDAKLSDYTVLGKMVSLFVDKGCKNKFTLAQQKSG